jgi:hypothetical protein
MDAPLRPVPWSLLDSFWRGLRYAGPINLLGWTAVGAVCIASVVVIVQSALVRRRLQRESFFQLAHVSYLVFLGCVGVGGQFFSVSHPDASMLAHICCLDCRRAHANGGLSGGAGRVRRSLASVMGGGGERVSTPLPPQANRLAAVAQGPRALLGRHRAELHAGRPVQPKKTATLRFFFDLDPSVLYRISALPDELAATLTPATPLTDALRIMGRLSDQMTEIRGRKGSLTGDSKQRVLAAIESLRRIVLKWPAWAAPATKRMTAKSGRRENNGRPIRRRRVASLPRCILKGNIGTREEEIERSGPAC